MSASDNAIVRYVINNAPVLRSEVCAALKCRKQAVTEAVSYAMRYDDQFHLTISMEVLGKANFGNRADDIRFTVRPSAFSLAQAFIRKPLCKKRKH